MTIATLLILIAAVLFGLATFGRGYFVTNSIRMIAGGLLCTALAMLVPLL